MRNTDPSEREIKLRAGIKDRQRIVVKIGSSSLRHKEKSAFMVSF